MAENSGIAPHGDVPSGQRNPLVAIKVVHTVVWALLVACIVAIPVVAWLRAFRLATVLSLLIWLECLVLVLNHWRCPLTELAAKYTSNREPDFDIYMPVWLARHNKTIFGTLFLIHEAVFLCCWLRQR